MSDDTIYDDWGPYIPEDGVIILFLMLGLHDTAEIATTVKNITIRQSTISYGRELKDHIMYFKVQKMFV